MRFAVWVLAAAVLAGCSYVAGWFLPIPAWANVAWKGAGVSLLAVYAALNARSLDGWLLAAVLAFGALGDMLLETHGLIVGALAFLAGHITATGLYLRNRRTAGAGDWGVAGGIVIGVTVAAYLLPPERAGAGLIALYALGLSIMAATAWLSRFPRPLVAAGALMFAVSDLLIFLRTGRPALDILPIGLAVWGLYFAGQALIAVGVVRGLRARQG
ncbi:MAG: lysoplasmalogenase [Phenylobacterium sp.]|uniref:lysoplasmalogenase family protein n=1 Tax=Phenylobacterium sp. TaxID=1871053 RepID=UPI0012259EE3|nr:lysoplasmalogenase family protein [Phenylobacterium sp.]TAL30864.1 MAG: lysoplasmalogenase [Phenylobacterium sp.]